MLILGIETSCDDTCVAVVEAAGGKTKPVFRILSNVVSSQIKIHAPFGGVVPNLAARAHAENFVPVLHSTLAESRVRLSGIDLIAVTTTPGLIPALLVGVHGARALAWALKKPILGINHLEGHIYANLLGEVRVNPKSKIQNPNQRKIIFPALCLLVSGGHTQLVRMRGHLKYKILGETRDDAAGEAFDKVAKLLGLPFPGGPPIAACAATAIQQTNELARKQVSEITNSLHSLPRSTRLSRSVELPRPMIASDDYDFSFSGLKTAVLYLVQKQFMRGGRIIITAPERAALCAEFQQAVIDVLVAKTLRAALRYKTETVVLGGGVGANKELRRQLGEALATRMPRTRYLTPPPGLSMDNAAMIAAAAYFRWLSGERKTWKDIRASA